MVLATLALPPAALVSTAPVSTCGVTLSWRTLTLENVREAAFEQSVTLRAFANSTPAAGAAPALAAFAIVFGDFTQGRRSPGVAVAVALGDIA